MIYIYITVIINILEDINHLSIHHLFTNIGV